MSRSLTRRHALRFMAAGAAGSAVGPPALAATDPAARTIRIGVAQPAIGTPPGFGGSAIAIAHAKGWFEEEFKADGLQVLNLDTAGYLTALSTKDIDAAIGSMDILRLRDKGQVRVLYSSKNDSPIFTRQGHVLVTDRFAEANPQLVQRVVNVAVRTAKWASDEANREEVLRLWARAGTPFEHWKEDYAGEPLRVRLNPNFDPFLVGRYKDAIEQAYRFKLSRAKFDATPWIDTRYLQTALREQKLENFWPIYQASGKILGA